MGENARTRSFFSPRARVLLYFFCFDGSDAREYVSFFCQVGWKKEKKKLGFDEKRDSRSKTHQNLWGRGGRKKNKEQK
jgi:hypothetical protein